MADAQTNASSTRHYRPGAALGADIVMFIILAGGGYYIGNVVGAIVGFLFALLLTFALSIRVLSQWNRKAVLRLGKYVGIIGPGFFLIIPFIDTTTPTIDTRIISTAFKAEKTLTKDNVPVDVDAILFWQVKNPEQTVLNVQSYYDSVLLASQTAMRDIIGKTELSSMLAGRDIIGKGIQNLIEQRIENWGITAISVEIRDVTIPPELQNAMARVATSDREKQARVILAESESLAADKMLEAAKKYETDPYAMQLRALNMMYEISLTGKNVMVFIPTETKGFSIPMPFGIRGLEEFIKQKDQEGPDSQKQIKKKKP
ncbi:MAG: slipin family protein [Candidatus Marsarchaeota archaeon]|nr:slipin family protein [Candidatus Marsarchaeota archaeon]MCL5115376.1 slipin family protein [Candidatus Marsarchaeota archaeon]